MFNIVTNKSIKQVYNQGSSFFVPAKLPKDDKKEENKIMKDKSVKFNNFAEVRHLQGWQL